MTDSKHRAAKAPFRDSDTPEIQEQISQLLALKYRPVRKTEYHLKIQDVNYYPHRGTITIDPSLRHSASGFEALLALLARKRKIKETLQQ
jgi:hypothetical protein